jgi:hypothetical protein
VDAVVTTLGVHGGETCDLNAAAGAHVDHVTYCVDIECEAPRPRRMVDVGLIGREACALVGRRA